MLTVLNVSNQEQRQVGLLMSALRRCVLHHRASFSDVKGSDDKLHLSQNAASLMSQLPDSCGHFAFVTSRLNFDSREEEKKRLSVRRLKDPVAS